MTGLELALGIAGGLTLARGAEIVMVSIAKARDRAAMRQDMNEFTEKATDFIDEMHKEHIARQEAEQAKKSARRRTPATKKAPVKPVATTKKTVTTKKGK